MSPLEEALAAVEAGDDARALVALVEAWRRRRVPALAALVARLDARVRRARPALDKKAWPARAAAALEDPRLADLGLLAETLVTPRSPESLARLEALAAVDDPRLAAALTAALTAPPFSSSAGARPFYRALFEAAARLADPRLLEEADSLRAAFARRFPGTGHGKDDLRRKLDRLLADVAARYPDGTPALDGADLRAAAALDAALTARESDRRKTSRSGAALLAAVEANLDDDTPRAMLADWLTEEGDPRGELILLQLAATKRPLTRDEQRRERALIDAHFADWLGPLARVVAKKGSRFARGFLAEAALKPVRRFDEVAGDRRWATVELLHVSGFLDHDALLAGAHLPSLRAVTGGGIVTAHIPALLANAGNLPRLAELGVEVSTVTPDSCDQLSRLTALPALTTLRVYVWDARAGAEALAGADAPSPIVEVLESRGPGRVRLEGDGGGRLVIQQ